jgi:hypothetical protein
MFPVAVYYNTQKTQNNTYKHSKQYTTQKLQTQ